MEPWSSLALDQPQLKTYLAVLLKERRKETWQDLAGVAMRSRLPVDVLERLEANEFTANLEPYLVKSIAEGYQISFEQMGDLVRVACVASLVNVMRTLDDDAD